MTLISCDIIDQLNCLTLKKRNIAMLNDQVEKNTILLFL